MANRNRVHTAAVQIRDQVKSVIETDLRAEGVVSRLHFPFGYTAVLFTTEYEIKLDETECPSIVAVIVDFPNQEIAVTFTIDILHSKAQPKRWRTKAILRTMGYGFRYKNWPTVTSVNVEGLKTRKVARDFKKYAGTSIGRFMVNMANTYLEKHGFVDGCTD